MSKVLAVARTLFLVFIVGYTLLNAPAEVWGSAAVAVRFESLQRVHRAAWLAIAWIAFETALAWLVIRVRRPRKVEPAERAPATEPGQPPVAPPPSSRS